MSSTETFNLPYLGEAAKKVTYDNGYTFVYVPKRGDVFNISTWVRTGSIHENDEISGISHFLEHLLFKGTERFGPGEFDRSMESMGAIINAATWKDFTFYYVTGPQGDNGANFDKALDMHSDMMLHSTLPQDEIGQPYNPDDPDYDGEKRERAVVIEEIGMREDQPWTKIYNAVNRMMYPEGHPYRRDVIGTRQIIGNVPRTTLEGYYRSWYGPDSLVTIIVGDFDADTLEQKVLKSFDFNKLPPKPDKITGETQYPTDIATNGHRFEAVKGDFQTQFFITGFHGPQPDNLEESIALDIISSVLGEGRSARLHQALVEQAEKPIFNMVGCSHSAFRLGGVFFLQGNFNSDDHQGCLDQVMAEINKMLTDEPMTPEEFKKAVKKLRVDFAETSETSSGIAELIGECETVIGTLRYYTDYLSVLDAMTLDKVSAVAQKYLDPAKAYTSLLIPENN